MKAPERLYVDTEDRLSGSILYGFTEKRKDDDIEYIRKDAVIGWLKDCSTYKDFNGNTCKDEDLFNTMIDDFRNYIKQHGQTNS